MREYRLIEESRAEAKKWKGTAIALGISWIMQVGFTIYLVNDVSKGCN